MLNFLKINNIYFTSNIAMNSRKVNILSHTFAIPPIT